MKKLFTLLFLASTLFASDGAFKTLSPKLQLLMGEEMREIEKGMKRMFSYIIAADYENIQKTATAIQNSYTFNKNLTKEMQQELRKKIPQAFMAIDMQLHGTAGDLANAAEFEDQAGVEKGFATMLNSCVACHSTYATHKFPLYEDE